MKDPSVKSWNLIEIEIELVIQILIRKSWNLWSEKCLIKTHRFKNVNKLE